MKYSEMSGWQYPSQIAFRYAVQNTQRRNPWICILRKCPFYERADGYIHRSDRKLNPNLHTDMAVDKHSFGNIDVWWSTCVMGKASHWVLCLNDSKAKFSELFVRKPVPSHLISLASSQSHLNKWRLRANPCKRTSPSH